VKNIYNLFIFGGFARKSGGVGTQIKEHDDFPETREELNILCGK
jgi:hypothetical protein